MSRRRAATRKSEFRTPRHRARRPSVIVNIKVPRALNRFIPAVVYEPPVRIQQDRYRHLRVPVAAITAGGVVGRRIRVIPRRVKRLSPALSMFRSGRLTHMSSRRTARFLSFEGNRRRYKERKGRRGRVSDGHLSSLSRDFGLLSPNVGSVEQLSDAALVSRAVFGG